MSIQRGLRRFAAGVALASSCLFAQASAEEPARIVAGLSSADGFMKDLEYLVVDLAKEKKNWTKNIFPNLDTFLIGVDSSRVVRMDIMFDKKDGQRRTAIIPYANFNEFKDDNLDPIDILLKKDPKDRTLYKVTGNVIEKGWLRIVDDYAIMTKAEADVPAGMPSPVQQHEALFAKGYDLGIQYLNTAETQAARTETYATVKANTLANVKPRSGETPEAFRLREAVARQQTEVYQRLFVELSEATGGWVTDKDANMGRGDSKFSALPGTDLAKWFATVGAQPSHFHAIAKGDDVPASVRVNLPIDEFRRKHMLETYEASRPVAKELINDDKDATAEQKAAGVEISNKILDLLIKNVEVGVLDVALEIAKTDQGKHAFLLGVRCDSAADIGPILELFPKAESDWSVQLDVDKADDVAIHTLTLKDLPKVLQDFYGESGTVYVGAGPKTLWFATGDGSLDVLKKAVDTVANGGEGQPSPEFVWVKIHALPILRVNKALKDDKRHAQIVDLLKSHGLMKDPKKETKKTTKSSKSGKKKESTNHRDALRNFEWAPTAIAFLKGDSDRIMIEAHKVEDHIESTMSVEPEVLGAVGKLIAKFAEENLGSN